MLERQARTGADLHLKAFRNGDGEAGRNRMAGTGLEGEFLGSDDVHSCRASRRVGRQRQALAMRQPLKCDVDHAFFFRAGAFLRPPFLTGPFAALASISATASSSVTAFGSALFGKVACVAPSLT